ncbi:MAG: NUDIX hydrolase [Nitrosopumilaceae archaeon]
MAKKLVYRSGVIPYYTDDHGKLQMLFMQPSSPKFGTDSWQIAKGKYEEGETAKEAGLREAGEELGLFKGNILRLHDLGQFLGRTTFFIAKIKDPTLFGHPHYETAATKWMTPEEFQREGRGLHKPVVQAAYRRIEQLEEENRKTIKEMWGKAVRLNEVLDNYPTKITWTKKGNEYQGYFNIEGHPYVAILEYIPFPIQDKTFRMINLAFAAIDEQGQFSYALQNWKTSPFKVLGGVLKAYDEKRKELEHDVLLLGVSNDYGNIEDRMRLYNFIANRYMKGFGTRHMDVKTHNGVVTILINTRITTPEERGLISSYVAEHIKLK